MLIHDIRKEFRSGLRDNKFVILAAGLLFFALLSPVMIKLMPAIMHSQFPDMSDEALSAMVDSTQSGCVKSYMGDVFEIGTLIVVFTLCGIMSQEIRDHSLVLPVCAGKSYAGITLSKLLVFGAVLVIIPTAALLVDYGYAGVLLGFDIPSAGPVVLGGLLQGLYMLFLLSCLLLFGVIVKRPIATGILTLIVAYGTHFVGGLFGITEYIPSGLMTQAAALDPTADILKTAAVTAALIIIFTAAAVRLLGRTELNKR